VQTDVGIHPQRILSVDILVNKQLMYTRVPARRFELLTCLPLFPDRRRVHFVNIGDKLRAVRGLAFSERIAAVGNGSYDTYKIRIQSFRIF